MKKDRSKRSRVLKVGIHDSDGSVDNGDIRFVICILHLVGIDEKSSVEKSRVLKVGIHDSDGRLTTGTSDS